MVECAEDYELFHYGIKGMKWGVRRKDDNGDGRVDATAKPTRKERRTEKRDERARTIEGRAAKLDVSINELKAEMDALPPGPKGVYQRANLNRNIQYNKSAQQALLKDAKSVRKSGLTRDQKMMIAGAVAVTALVGAAYLSTKVDSGEFNAMKLRGEALLKGQKFDFKKNKSLAGKMSPDEAFSKVVKGINPNYKKPGGAMNCRRTAFTYELRRRGYDVVATTSVAGTGQSETGVINALTPGQRNITRSDSLSKMVTSVGKGIRSQVDRDNRSNPAETLTVNGPGGRLLSANTLKDAFSKQPSGARGEIVFNFGRFGHAMAYEIFDGKPVIFDAQKAQKYEVDEVYISQMMSKWGTTSQAAITRLDNVDLDHKFLARWMTNAS